MNYPIITLKTGKEKSLLNQHPWVFSGAIHHKPATLREGDIVQIQSVAGQFLALGHYYPGNIMVRCFSFEPLVVEDNFWQQRLEAAYQVRKTLGLTENKSTNCYRLVHAEGDFLPGLIIDMYHQGAVIQFQTSGMTFHQEAIKQALLHLYPNLTHIYALYIFDTSKNGYLLGGTPTEKLVVQENGYQLYVDWENGQKTGFFIDQRENRALIAQFAQHKTVLNAFSYTGGFSIYALGAGAKEVHSVDSSAKAIQMAKEQVALNFGTNAPHTGIVADCFDYLKNIHQQYDVIVLDPPAFAKHIDAVKNASIGYKQINLQAFRHIRKGGILATFSCSQSIDKTLFRKIIFGAAADAKRKVRVLHQLTQPADHPINIYHPEGEYLKGLLLYVE